MELGGKEGVKGVSECGGHLGCLTLLYHEKKTSVIDDVVQTYSPQVYFITDVRGGRLKLVLRANIKQLLRHLIGCGQRCNMNNVIKLEGNTDE